MAHPQDKLSRVTKNFRLMIAIACLFIISFIISEWAENQIVTTEEAKLTTLNLTQELTRSANDLTLMVRAYIATGDPIYKQYFQELLEIRDGKNTSVSLTKQLRSAGFTQEELRKFAEIKTDLDSLARMDITAMELVAANPGSELNRTNAMQIINNLDYILTKTRVIQAIQQLTQLSDQRSLNLVIKAKENALLLDNISRFFGLLLIYFAWKIYQIYREVLGGSTHELYKYVSSINNGDYSSPFHINNHTQNGVIGILAEIQKKLSTTTAQHDQDALTIQELKESEERLSLAVEGTNDGLWDRNFEQGKVYYSPRWKSILRYNDNELTNTEATWVSHIHPEDADWVVNKIESCAAENKQHFQCEYRMRCKNGEYIWVLDRGIILCNDEGTLIRSVGVLTDISAHKQVEKIKSEFISMISHGLRTPLTSIHGSLHLLDAGVMGELPYQAHDMVKMARKNSERLIKLVDEILDMEKLTSDIIVFQQKDVNLIKIIEQSIEMSIGYATSFGVRYMLAPFEGECHITSDAERLFQILTNLLSNAAKFSHQGGIVHIRILLIENFVRVEIEDHGNGIPFSFRNKIFGEFAQAETNDSKHHDGIGLGLHITQKLVNKLGGEIGYDTEISRGTTFWFTLPMTTS